MIDVNTIIGEPITSPDGTLIIPVSKVSYGFAAGGSDLPTKRKQRLLWRRQRCRCDNSACCISYRLSGRCKAVSVDREEGTADKLVNMIPDVLKR